MSEFDKEAERERLREKYEQDQADREATKRMSDLLLKGARMTNTHCGTCGDPLFEQNEVTFCPGCHGGPGGVEASVEDASGREAPTSTESDTETEAQAPETSTSRAAGANPDSTAAMGTDETLESESKPTRDRSGEPTPGRQPESTTSDTSPGPEHQPSVADRSVRGHPEALSTEGEVAAGRTALAAAVSEFARRAVEAEDPRTAKAHLEAAREAAEALAVLD